MRLVFILLSPLLLLAQSRPPQRAVTDPGVVTTRQAITPAGVTSVFDGRVYGVSWSPQGDHLWVLGATELQQLDWKNNEVKKKVALGGSPGIAGLRTHPQTGEAVFGSSSRGAPAGPRLATFAQGSLKILAQGLGKFQVGGVGVSTSAPFVIAPLIYENKAVVVDVTSGAQQALLDTGIAPWAAILNAEGTVAYVANLGGRPPRSQDLFASSMEKPSEKITVDARGIASTGTVQRFDLATGKVTHTIPVGLHPASLAWDEQRQLLYVANGNTDNISVINTANQQVVATLPVQIYNEKAKGISPTALALNADGTRLFVACGGINAVAVFNTSTRKMTGLIPTAWYPNALALSPDGRQLAIASLLGAGSAWRDEPKRRFVHSYRGSVSVVDVPDEAQLASYTTAVAENNRVRLSGGAAPNPKAKPKAIPLRSGEPSLIEHVVYIVKENRTYDQLFGDLPQGNGDPSLVMFGRKVTPNQHKLAEDFVLLDNLYATGGNSADGHQWLTQSNEVEYALWPGYQGRSYPFDGTDPMAYSEGGFLWDYAIAKGKTVRVYGEYAGRLSEPIEQRMKLFEEWKAGNADFSNRWNIKAPIDPLNKILAANYPTYTNSIPDVVRAQIFLKDLARFTREGKFPNLVLLQLPSDHTFGARPGASSPSAMVADNDYALGQIVEGLSQSPFWPKMAIFVIEDDAQNGVDHVDGHRMPGLVISPYTKRKSVDSTFYANQSVNKTIELILGLPTMSLFDIIANDMRASFTDTPDLTPFKAVEPTYDLYELNPPVRALKGLARDAAIASNKMNWDVPDAAPTERVNRILWGMLRGWDTHYPAPKNAVFSPLAIDIEDEEREEKKERKP
ncbi:MAG: alkaline phosphatase family protein [Bryobacter sp.]|nr:alkaline phosphatase family protein [Bryobacter sp.]